MNVLDLVMSSLPTRLLIWPVSKIVSPLNKRILESIANHIRVEKPEAYIESEALQPRVSLNLILDSKTPVNLEIYRVGLNMYIEESSPFDRFIWSQEDEYLWQTKPLEGLGHENIRFECAPPMHLYFTNTCRIRLMGYIGFKCLFGVVHKHIDEYFDIKAEDKNKAKKRIKEYYKQVLEN